MFCGVHTSHIIRHISRLCLGFLLLFSACSRRGITCGPSVRQSIEVLLEEKPMGWCVYDSTGRYSAADYPIDGAPDSARTIVIYSTGEDMADSIERLLPNYDRIVFNGAGGDIIVSHPIHIRSLTGKRLMGINDVRIRTQFRLTPDVLQGLRALPLDSMSSQGGGFRLSNGKQPHEQRESAVRQFLIDYYQDPQESYSQAGIFVLNDAHQIVIQSIRMQGPGSCDIGGSDLITICHGSDHIWIDHCEFLDGQDGNMDFNSFADLITVSHCRFAYTDRSFDHCLSNLIGSTDDAKKNGDDKLNVTFAYCTWDRGCKQRMPMARFGQIHIYRCQYNCVGNDKAIDVRQGAQVLVEETTFASGVRWPYQLGRGGRGLELKNCHLSDFALPHYKQGETFVPPYK